MENDAILKVFSDELMNLNPAPTRTVSILVSKFKPNPADIFINFYNLPLSTVRARAGGGAEAENNRVMYCVSRYEVPNGCVRVEESCSVFGKAYRLRAKTGTPEKIAAYLAERIEKIATEVEPNYTHSARPAD